MKTVTITTMRELDRRAIEEFNIPSLILMENAGIRVADIIHRHCRESWQGKHIMVVCGRGNNGGDGLVVARHLANRNYKITVFVLADREHISGDALTNLIIFEKMAGTVYFTKNSKPDKKFIAALAASNCVVDAIFGTGLDRSIQEPVTSYIEVINNAGKKIISIDAPSGIHCDTGDILGSAIKAHHTVTLGIAKRGFMLRRGPEYVGTVHVVDISIPKQLIDAAQIIEQ